MLSKKIEKALNDQIALEAYSSAVYLSMASWMENEGFEGTASFLYNQSDEERMHMMKLFHYVNTAGGLAISPSVDKPPIDFVSFSDCFNSILKQEEKVSQAIHNLINMAIKENDHTTNNFLQWYVSEQMEEEAQFRSIIDKIKILGKDGSGLYLLDRDLANIAATAAPVSVAKNKA